MQDTPAEALAISPEGLEIANSYLTLGNVDAVANSLGIAVEVVTATVNRKHIKAYINQVFFETGFNNRGKMREAMDSLIQKKFQDMTESDTGSTKDITDILALSHKMTMEIMDREIQLLKLKEAAAIKTQNNIQINNTSNYEELIAKLVQGEN